MRVRILVSLLVLVTIAYALVPGGPSGTRPSLIVTPIYPLQPNGAREEGQIDIDIVVEPSGRVTAAHATSGPARLRRLSEEVIKQWKFYPGGKDPTNCTMIFKFIARRRGEIPANTAAIFREPNLLEIYGDVPGKSIIVDPGVTDGEHPKK
jgi:hypothetical protein